ncbi:MAG: hypothetical protein OCD76_16800 [Reichenbachiella sp.]
MKGNLEEFIQGNRGEFDEMSPKADLWSKIEGKLDKPSIERPKPKSKILWQLGVAASVLLAFVIGLLVRPSIDGPTEQLAEIEVKNPTQELYEVESYYAKLIDEKKANIRLILNENKMIDQEMLEDLDDLDTMYDDLKYQLTQSQNNERVINAMIQNLQLRVEILNKQLMILGQLSKKQGNEEIAI